MAGGEKGFADVAGDDFFRFADGGEIDALVPAEQKIEVRRYLVELGGGEFPIEERAQQSGDARALHEVLIVDGRGRAGLLAWQEASSLLLGSRVGMTRNEGSGRVPSNMPRVGLSQAHSREKLVDS